MKIRKLSFVTSFVLFFGATALQAQTPRLMHYEGQLKDEQGQPFVGVTDLVFNIYKTANGESPIWSESHVGVQIENGNYGVLLGSKTPLKLSFFEYYLEVKTSTVTAGQPRRMIVGSGYNFRLWFLFAAYTIVWVAIFIYVLSIGRRQKKIAAELAALTRDTGSA